MPASVEPLIFQDIASDDNVSLMSGGLQKNGELSQYGGLAIGSDLRNLWALVVVLLYVILEFGIVQVSHAEQGSEVRMVRSEYLRLRNIDPTGDEPIHRTAWASVVSKIHAVTNKQRLDEESAYLRLLGAEGYLRLFQTSRDASFLIRAQQIVVPVATSRDLSPQSRAEAALLVGDVLVALGEPNTAMSWYSSARGFSGEQSRRAEQRLQGLRNGTFRSFLPSRDREIPRIRRKQSSRFNGKKGPVVVLDPGHGGIDSGAMSQHGGVEKEITLDIAQRVREILEKQHGVTVHLTREQDTFVPLGRRTAFANRKGADVFVSLHVNASEKHDAEGLEAYYLDNTNDEASRKLAERENGVLPGEAVDDVSFMLSDLIQSGKLEDSILLTRALEHGIRARLARPHRDLRSLGVKRAPFFVLVGAHMPCSLIEMFFVDNPNEGRRLRDGSFRAILAYGIADGVSKFLVKR